MGHFPTPLEPMDNLRHVLKVRARLFIKRDDCTGLGMGGNKTRKLEFLMADARGRGADIVVVHGAVQSNHVRQAAAASVRCGVECHALLERRVPDVVADYEETGNVLLDDIFGATYEFRPMGTDMDAEAEALCDRLRAAGRVPYLIPNGGSSPIGALGYAACALEMAEQWKTMAIRPTLLVHPTGSTGTQSGLLAGMSLLEHAPKIIGVSVRWPETPQIERVAAMARATGKLLGKRVSPDNVFVDDRFLGVGYGMPNDSTIAAIETLARTEGILLDPVYSGKAFAGFLSLLRENDFGDDEDLIFLHTGGLPALFAYRQQFAEGAMAKTD